MTQHRYLDDDERVVIEERRRGGAGKWILVLALLAALAVGAFFLLGGSADVDTKGELQVPNVDVDVNAPDVSVDTQDAPPASANAEDDTTTTIAAG